MSGKILTILILCILLLTVISDISLGESISKKFIEDSNEIIDEMDDTDNHSFGNYIIITDGPISRLFAKVNIQDGPLLITLLINRNLNRRILRLSALLTKITYPISKGINFTVEYKRNVRNNSRYSYLTTYFKVLYDENGSVIGFDLENRTTIYSKAHKIKVENFRFAFTFKRLQLIWLRAPLGQKIFNPARFVFFGICDNVTII